MPDIKKFLYYTIAGLICSISVLVLWIGVQVQFLHLYGISITDALSMLLGTLIIYSLLAPFIYAAISHIIKLRKRNLSGKKGTQNGVKQ